MKLQSKQSKSVKPTATRVSGGCSLPNCPICGDPVLPNGSSMPNDGLGPHRSQFGETSRNKLHRLDNKRGRNSGSPTGTTLDRRTLTHVPLNIPNLKDQVNAVLAQHPQLSAFIGHDPSGQPSTEAVTTCYLLEEMCASSWPGQINFTASKLRAAENRASKTLPEPVQRWVNVALTAFCKTKVGVAPLNAKSTFGRLLAIAHLIQQNDRSYKMLTSDGRYSTPRDSDFTLAVKGRPDLTRVKRHLLKRAGKSFQRNDYLALQLDPQAAAALLAHGTFKSGTDVIHEQMEMSNCHRNASILAAFKGVEMWRGFGLTGSLWAFHSWCVFEGRIIETTVPRELYFGIPVPTTFHKMQIAAVLRGLQSKRPKAKKGK